MSLLDALIYGVRTVQAAGSAVTLRSVINFTGSGVTVADNPGQGRTDVTITAGGGGATLPVNHPCVEKGASYALVSTTDYQVVFTGAGPWTATLPASPATGDEYLITNESSANVTVASSGGTLGFLVAGSTTVAPGQSVTYRKSTSANWIAS